MKEHELLSPERIAELKATLESLEAYIQVMQSNIKSAEEESRANTELRQDVYLEIANKNRTTKIRQFQARPINKQVVATSQLLAVQDTVQELRRRVEDTLLLLNYRMYEKAKLVHEALREASKTDPSLEAVVREMDALYQQDQEEQQEDATSEDSN